MSKKRKGKTQMIDFKEELAKYKPIMTMDEVEEAITDEIQDIMDLLQYISGKKTDDNSADE